MVALCEKKKQKTKNKKKKTHNEATPQPLPYRQLATLPHCHTAPVSLCHSYTANPPLCHCHCAAVDFKPPHRTQADIINISSYHHSK
jgi:hypothetical protein